MKEWLKVTLAAARGWSADNAFMHAAAISYYTLFSMAPISIIALAVAGIFFGHDAAQQQMQAQLTQLVGRQGAEAIQQGIVSNQLHASGWLSGIVGGVILLLGATTVFGQMQDSLNQIWGVMATPKRSGLVVLLVHRLISFTMVLTIGFLLLVSLILTTALTAAVKYLGGGSEVLLPLADFGGALVVVTLLFALIFKILPDVELRWSDVWRAAILTALLFDLGRFMIALYLSHTAVASGYGAAGSIVALLVWVYYSAAILFFGVEFCRATVTRHGRGIVPKSTAVRVRREIVK